MDGDRVRARRVCVPASAYVSVWFASISMF